MQQTRQLKVSELMQTKVYTVYSDQTALDASVLMASKGVGTLPVVKKDGTSEGVLIGVMTDRDIVTRCIAVGKDPHKTKVSECISANPIRTVPSASVGDTVTLMKEYGVRRLPVVENNRLVGLISISDIAKVSTFCPNENHPDETCILIDIANELKKSSHCEHRCNM